MVRTPSISDRCAELVHIMLYAIAPEANPGEISTISERELEQCVEVTAIALCWHLAATGDSIRAGRVIKDLMNETLGLAVGVEAAGIATKRGITLSEALQEMAESVGLTQAEERGDWNQRSAEKKTQHAQHQTDGTTPIEAFPLLSGNANQNDPYPRRLPPLVVPPGTLRHRCERVAQLIGSIDNETKRGVMSAIDNKEIEERARACHLMLCWSLGAISMTNSALRHQLEGRWMKAIPDLVALTIAVGNAENERITVMEALRQLRKEPTVFHLETEGGTCVWWLDADGRTQMSGPRAAEEVMNELIRANDFLLAASNAIGVNVNTVSPDALDQLASEHHSELAQLVADGSAFDVSRGEYQAFIEHYGNLSDRELAQGTSQFVVAGDVRLDEVAIAARRSFLIRAHMMRAKIEERERRRIVLN